MGKQVCIIRVKVGLLLFAGKSRKIFLAGGFGYEKRLYKDRIDAGHF